MKKDLLCAIALALFANISIAQSTATDFTANDCVSTNSVNLFTQLNSGKVIVMVWVMPCGMCDGGAQAAYNLVQSYSAGQVLFYLVDGNNDCNGLNTYANSISITPDAIFSDATISMNNYGSIGMPKVVVLGGNNHKVYDNQDNSFNTTALQDSINLALADIASAGIYETANINFHLSVFPNPAKEQASTNYVLSKPEEVIVEMYNVLGKKVKIIYSGKQDAGKHEHVFSLKDFDKGMYIIKITAGDTFAQSEVTIY